MMAARPRMVSLPSSGVRTLSFGGGRLDRSESWKLPARLRPFERLDGAAENDGTFDDVGAIELVAQLACGDVLGGLVRPLVDLPADDPVAVG
jgi:hypothetical protein